MGALQIISADERMQARAQQGAKILICGPAGIGKTTLLKTLDPETTLFMDFEAGDLALGDFPVDQVSPKTWDECRNLACYLSGGDPQAAADAVYGQQHYDYCVGLYGDTDINKYRTYYVDSLSVASRLCLAWAQQQPEATNAKGVPDMRAAYGILGKELIGFVTRLQQCKDKNVVFVCLLDENQDEFKRTYYTLQLEGGQAKSKTPGIVDEVITMGLIRPSVAGESPYRALVTDPANAQGWPAKDRSGHLDPIEEPHLGKLIKKVLTGSSE